ncbi:MAG: alpha-hydroxy acid oxidase [Planctomycetaceae bacterium]
MNRRVFSQLLAAGAGFVSAASRQAGGQEQPEQGDADGNATAAQEMATNPLSSLPVTLEDFIPLAKAKLPGPTFDYITSGSEDEVTLKDNVAAFRRLRVLPPLLHGVNSVDLSTTVLGQNISLPVMLAPVAALRMFHPQGARASARAATRAGTICIPSSSAHNSLEEIAESAAGPKWFQLYAPRERQVAAQLVRRVENAGYKALVVTVDLGERKDADLRNRFFVPQDFLLKHLRDCGFTHLTGKNTYEELVAFNLQAWNPSLDKKFFEWLRSQTKLPIILKGVLTEQAALDAHRLGLNGVIVSNHGGRRLDGMPASIDMLKNVADAVGDHMEIYFDSGIRRGGDVLKAIALGARAVLIGRPQAWALAAGGETGVKRALDILRDELTNAMLASGCRTVAGIDESLLL